MINQNALNSLIHKIHEMSVILVEQPIGSIPQSSKDFLSNRKFDARHINNVPIDISNPEFGFAINLLQQSVVGSLRACSCWLLDDEYLFLRNHMTNYFLIKIALIFT